MTSPKSKNVADDGSRMRDGARRLEELLRGAGPEIKVTARDPAAARQGAPAQGQRPAPSATQGRQPVPAQATSRGTQPIPPGGAQASAPAQAGTQARRPPSPPQAARPAGSPQSPQPSQPSKVQVSRPPAPGAHPGGGQSPAARGAQKASPKPQVQPRVPTGRPTQPAGDPRVQPRTHTPGHAPAARSPGAVPDNRVSSRIVNKAASFVTGPDQPPSMPPAQTQAGHGGQNSTAHGVPNRGSELENAIALSKRAFMAAGLFSFVINILMLAGPLFMLQVYDRVLTSGSVPTLIALSVMTAVAYLIIGVLELVRSRVIVRIGMEVEGRVSQRVFNASLRHSLAGAGQTNHALRELDHIRQFIASPGPLTLFDAPWTPIYLMVIFMAHWLLGVTATIGACILLVIAWISETSSRTPQQEAGTTAARALELSDTGQRNAEALTAMGMIGAYRARWQEANNETLAWQLLAADRLGGLTALSKTLKLLLQSMMLGIGAWLALNGHISAGAIVAATIIFGRALAPVDQAIGHWRQFLKARSSYAKLDALLKSQPAEAPKTSLPTPKGHLGVHNLRVAAPQTRQLILANVGFKVEPGQALAVIGPSASGKSTLVRALVGLWTPASGTVTLDGARLDQWDSEALGRHIGYLPQSVELFSGTVKENISRFCSNARPEEVVVAAKQAHAHEMILELPQGYDTQLGPFATHLSGGQKQRMALARALFRNPALVVLDEPNANLDRVGDVALDSAIEGLRARGQTVVLVSHRVQAIGKADLLLYLDRGVQRAFGPRDEVMKLFREGQGGDPAATPGAPQSSMDSDVTKRGAP